MKSTENRLWRKRHPTRQGWYIFIIAVAASLFLALIIPGFFQASVHLLLGWIPFIGRSLTGMVWNPGMIASGVIALLASGILLHGTVRWWARQSGRRWPVRQTVAILFLVIVLFASSICGAGIGHQVGWLFANPLVSDKGIGYITRESNAMRQVSLGMKLYASDHDGRYPDRLEDLVREQIIDPDKWSQLVLSPAGPAGEPEPLLYFGAGLDESAAGDILLLASARPKYSNNRRVVCTNDGSVKTYTEKAFQRLFADQMAPVHE